MSTKDTIATKFEAVGLAENSYVSVRDGEKKCVDHDTRWSDPRDVPGDNYGIYADEDDQLVILDVDYHKEGSENLSPVAMGALGGLPLSLKLKSPHVLDGDRGGHRIYKLAGDQTPAELFKEKFGAKNPVPSWGEVIAKNKYIVGAGSQLDYCTKEWCDVCATSEGGYYSIKEDREIATVDPDTLVEALAADPDLGENSDPGDNKTLDLSTNDGPTDTDRDYDGSPAREGRGNAGANPGGPAFRRLDSSRLRYL